MIKKPIFFSKEYFPLKADNRMSNVGDVKNARDFFFRNRPSNLEFLLRKRYEWMNAFIQEGDKGIEVGCGSGFAKNFISSHEFLLTDVVKYDWVDQCVDALNMPFKDSSLDFIVSSNMIHHLACPYEFFTECSRVLKPNGLLIIQEVNASLVMRMFLKIMRHEGYTYDVNVFDKNFICNDPLDPWSANCVVPNLLFDDIKQFEKHFPFQQIHHSYSEFLMLLISGGVTAKTKTINFSSSVLNWIDKIDDFLIKLNKNIFALQRQIVLRNKK